MNTFVNTRHKPVSIKYFQWLTGVKIHPILSCADQGLRGLVNKITISIKEFSRSISVQNWYFSDNLPGSHKPYTLESSRGIQVLLFLPIRHQLLKRICFWRVCKHQPWGEKIIQVLNRYFVAGVNNKRCEKCLDHCAEAREQHTQPNNSESIDGARGIFDTDNPRMTAQPLANQLVSVLYTCHSDVQMYRPTSVTQISTITIVVIKN
jgi:hypothetical protein